MTVRFGGQLWSQNTSWPAVRDAAVGLERAGWDGVWTWDHLLAIVGPDDQPIFEGPTLLAGLAPLTRRVTLGLMVGANTFRNAGLIAKVVTTLDHLSGGRAVLGIGGAWFEREHTAFGLPFGASPGERLDRLDESVDILRRLLDGERVDHEGRFYRLHDAFSAPRPIQHRLPVLVGGAGPRKTLRIVARHADAWNSSGSPDQIAERIRVLGDHCRDVGRDPAAIELTASITPIVRDDPAEAERVAASQARHNGVDEIPYGPILRGSPTQLADRLRPFVALGVRHFIARLPTPFDHETIERMGEVRALLEN